MGFFDLIAELRTGQPDIKKAEKAMKTLGWLCLLGAVWNLIFDYLEPMGKDSFINLPPSYIYTVVIGFVFLGLLFFQAARGIRQMETWGRRTGQVAVGLFVGMFFLFMYYMFHSGPFQTGEAPFPVFIIIVAVLVVAQFAVPGYYGIRYLGRLPVNDGTYASYQAFAGEDSRPFAGKGTAVSPEPQAIYHDSPSRLGVYGTFALLLGVPLLLVFIASKYLGEEIMPLFILPVFLFIFLGPMLYNRRRSPFEEGSALVASFTGGGSISLFNGSWPFFRLMVYEDAVEVRIMFQRYLIPYDRMDDLPEKVGFFTTSILFQSSLPGVPSRIRFAASK